MSINYTTVDPGTSGPCLAVWLSKGYLLDIEDPNEPLELDPSTDMEIVLMMGASGRLGKISPNG